MSLCQRDLHHCCWALSCPSDLRVIERRFTEPGSGAATRLPLYHVLLPEFCIPRTSHLGHIQQNIVLGIFKFQEDTKA